MKPKPQPSKERPGYIIRIRSLLLIPAWASGLPGLGDHDPIPLAQVDSECHSDQESSYVGAVSYVGRGEETYEI